MAAKLNVLNLSPSRGVGRFFVLFTSSGAFTGYFPVASGTFGSLVGVALVWATRSWSVPSQSLLATALLLLGVWVSHHAAILHRQADASKIVIDEIVGMQITMIGIPVTLPWLVTGFLIFRFLDVIKFPPANFFDERLKNGWGVMLDDVVSGLYGCLWLHLMWRTSL